MDIKKQKIYFVCPYMREPIGGIKQIYRQVEILSNHQYNVSILQKKPSAPIWFNSSAKVEVDRYLFKSLKYLVEQEHSSTPLPWNKRVKLWYLKWTRKPLDKEAIIVIPEIYGDFISVVEPTMKKVIFNQNAYKSFEHITYRKKLNPYYNSNTIGCIVVSEDSKNYLKYCFPQLNIARIRLGINHDHFYLSNIKKKQIVYMTRKLGDDVVQVVEILKTRTMLNDWELIPIHNKSEIEVAKLMRESLIFLSFSNREGFGLPPAEAMASGCVVVGYTGGSGSEFFKENFSYTIKEGNIIDYVKKIEDVIVEYNKDPNSVIQKGVLAASYIANNYNMENEENDILNFWGHILP